MYRIGKEELEEIARVIETKQLFRVPDPMRPTPHLGQCARFEEEWSTLIGTQYTLLMCGGGTAALECALAGIGVGPGDEVLVPAYTWMATATSVLAVGAIPVLTEVDATLSMDPEDVVRKITPQTKAIIPVHMIGRPANMAALCQLAQEHGLKIVEDCSQCDGGSFGGRRVGSWGDAGAFSFNYFKIISTGGEGGCLVTNDRSIFETAFVYHDSGSAFRPKAAEMTVPIFVAHQFRADEVMGALARVQMRRLDGILDDLRRVRRRFEQALDGVGDLKVAPTNDVEGDCGVCVLFRFAEESRAAEFARALGPKSGYHCIDHHKHVYTNWTPLREQRVFHHPEMNPFHFPKNRGLRVDYTESACPATLDLLRRSYIYLLDPDWTEGEIDERISLCKSLAL